MRRELPSRIFVVWSPSCTASPDLALDGCHDLDKGERARRRMAERKRDKRNREAEQGCTDWEVCTFVMRRVAREEAA